MGRACQGRGPCASSRLGEAAPIRRDLQHRIFELDAAYEAEIADVRARRLGAEALWPAVIAAERLGYRLLAACWAAETGRAGEGETAVAALEFEAALEELGHGAWAAPPERASAQLRIG
jgi:hypothetical protein